MSKTSFHFFAWFAIFFAPWVHAEPEQACSAQATSSMTSITTIKALPASIRSHIASYRADTTPIADAGEAFNAGDVIVDKTPQRRFVSATSSGDCIFVTIEYGGRGYFVQTFSFWRNHDAWIYFETRPGANPA